MPTGLITRAAEGIRWRVAPYLGPVNQRLYRSGWRPISRSIDRLIRRINPPDIAVALKKLGASENKILVVHSSLSACGYVCGGPASIIAAVQPTCGTLALPSHSYCYPGDVREEGPVFDPRATRSVVGEITDHFWRQPGVCRSIHPTHSLAASGGDVEPLLAGHVTCTTPCGSGTPYERLICKDAAVLMFGATMNTYTLFHTAEDAAACPYLYCKTSYLLRAIDYEGQLHRLQMFRQDMSVPRRFESMDRILEVEGLLRRTRLGRGALLFVPSAQAVHQFVGEHLKRDPFYLVHPAHREKVERKCA